MTKPRRYPWVGFAGIPPDPRRKSTNLVVYGQRVKRGPLDVYCCNGCVERGKARPDGSCRHTDIFLASIRPWWRRRARIEFRTTEAP